MSRSARGTSFLVAALTALVAVLMTAAPAIAVTSWSDVPGATSDDLIVTPIEVGQTQTPGFSYTARPSGIADYCTATDPAGGWPCPTVDYRSYFTLTSATVTGRTATVTLVATTANSGLSYISMTSWMSDHWEQVFSTSSHGWVYYPEIIGGRQVGQSNQEQVICTTGVPCTVSYGLNDDYTRFTGDKWLAAQVNGSQIFIPLGSVGGITAAFTATRSSSSDVGQYQFVSTSTDAAGGALTQTWDLGDGTTASGGAVTHGYTKPGTYHVKLTATNQSGRSASVTHDVVVAAPTLSVTPTIVGSADVAPGDPVAVDVLVSASSDGVGDLSGLHWDAATPAGLAPTPASALTGISTPALPSTLSPGQSTTLHFTATAGSQPVRAALGSTLDGTDASGAAVTASGSVNLKIATHALTVTVTPDTARLELAFDANGDPIPQDDQVTIEITNTSDEPVDGVTMAPLTLAATDATHPYTVFPGEVLDPNPSVDVGTIAAGATVSVTRTVRITDYADLTASTLVTSAGGDSIVGNGRVTAGLPALTMSWQMDQRWDGTTATIITAPEQLDPSDWGFAVTVTDGCNASNADEFGFTIGGIAPDELQHVADSCSFHFVRADLAKFTISATLIRSGRVAATGSLDIQGRDFVIAAVGDSLSSGEGLPSGTWSLQQCHRSVDSGSGLAATRLELADRHSAVDYISLACSGATTNTGLIGPYTGIEPGAPLAAQLTELTRYAAVRAIDSVVFSIGANDIKFGPAVTTCIGLLTSSCGPDTPIQGTTLSAFMSNLVGELPMHYADVNQYLRAAGVAANHVIVLTYPDSTHSDTAGNPYCGSSSTNGSSTDLDAVGISTLSQASWHYLHDTVLLPLNQAVEAAAQRYGWLPITTAEAAFLNHGYCSSDPWITTILDSLQTEGSVVDGGFHPNAAGYVWYGQQIFTQLDAMLLPGGSAVAAAAARVIPVTAAGTVSAGSVAPGGQLDVSGSGFAIGEGVDVTLHSTPVLLTTVAPDAFGLIHATVTIPADTAPGAHEVILTGKVTGNTVSIPITVTAPAARVTAAGGVSVLATTGADPGPLLTDALVAIAAGAGLLAARGIRRRWVRRSQAAAAHRT